MEYFSCLEKEHFVEDGSGAVWHRWRAVVLNEQGSVGLTGCLRGLEIILFFNVVTF